LFRFSKDPFYVNHHEVGQILADGFSTNSSVYGSDTDPNQAVMSNLDINPVEQDCGTDFCKKRHLHLLFTVHCVNTVPSEAASQQQDVVVRRVLAQQHPLPMSLINSSVVSLSSCPSNRGVHTHTHTHCSTALPSANVTSNQSELLCTVLPVMRFTVTNCLSLTRITYDSLQETEVNEHKNALKSYQNKRISTCHICFRANSVSGSELRSAPDSNVPL